MLIPLSYLFGLYVLTPGRRIYTLRQVRKLVASYNRPDILAAIDDAIAHDHTVIDMDATWRKGGPSSSIRDKDALVDRTLGIIEQLLSHYAQAGDDTAAAIHSKLFPISVGHHTHLPYFDQSAANERVLAILESPEHQGWLDAEGLRSLIQRLRAAHNEFAAELDSRDSGPTLAWADVKAAHEAGQDMYLQVVAMIAGHFAQNAPIRSEVLQPVWKQNQAIQAYRRRRRSVSDIDPDSGEPLDGGDEPGDGDEAQTPEPASE